MVDDLNESIDHDEHSEQKHDCQKGHRENLLIATGVYVAAVVVTVVRFALRLLYRVGWSVERFCQVSDDDFL